MECVLCGENARYNRAVIDRVEQRTLGGLCAECEHEQVGRSLEDDFWELGRGCLFCDDHGTVALPVHKIDIDDVAGTDRTTEGYHIDPDTPVICGAHAEEMLGIEPRELGERTELGQFVRDPDT